jgi:hypothetical protein
MELYYYISMHISTEDHIRFTKSNFARHISGAESAADFQDVS